MVASLPRLFPLTSNAVDCLTLASGKGIDDMCSKANGYLSYLARFSPFKEPNPLPYELRTATIFTT